eukprot:797568_1
MAFDDRGCSREKYVEVLETAFENWSKLKTLHVFRNEGQFGGQFSTFFDHEYCYLTLQALLELSVLESLTFMLSPFQQHGWQDHQQVQQSCIMQVLPYFDALCHLKEMDFYLVAGNLSLMEEILNRLRLEHDSLSRITAGMDVRDGHTFMLCSDHILMQFKGIVLQCLS